MAGTAYKFCKTPMIVFAIMLGVSPVSVNAETKPLTVLDDFIRFADPETCAFADDMQIMLDNLWTYDEQGDGRPAFDKLVVPDDLAAGFYEPVIVGDEAGVSASISVNGQWLGLNVYEIRSFAPAGGDPPSVDIAFTEDVRIVRQRLAIIGIHVNENGHYIVDLENGVYAYHTYVLRVHENPELTHYSCLTL